MLFFARLLNVSRVAPVLEQQSYMHDISSIDRGRNGTLVWAAPPSEPDGRVSRIRLSG
jgi:hypothetical protein